MRWVWMLMVISTLGWSRVPSQMLVLTGDTELKPVTIASLELQLHVERDPYLEHLFQQHHLRVAIEHDANMHLLVVTPIRSVAVENALKLALADRYPAAFCIRSSSRTLESDGIKHAPLAVPPRGSVWQPIDWAWLLIWGLAVLGLVASIYRRRHLIRVSQEQTHLTEEQHRIDASIDSLQGERHG